jgi:hypothetical protein
MAMDTLEKSWDDSLKNLVSASLQAFVEWLLGKAQYKRKLPYKKRQVADTMFLGLQATGRTELITIGGTLASYMFSRENTADLGWLHRRLREMHDILRESPYYQEILEEGREEGLEKGREQGQLEALRQTVIDIVLERFPKMIRTTRKQVAFVEDPAILRHLIVKMSISQSMEEAKQHLLKVDIDEED